jgi:hypothetical protein
MESNQINRVNENFSKLLTSGFEPFFALHKTSVETISSIAKINLEASNKIFSLYLGFAENIFTSKEVNELQVFNKKLAEEVCDNSVKKVNEILTNISKATVNVGSIEMEKLPDNKISVVKAETKKVIAK